LSTLRCTTKDTCPQTRDQYLVFSWLNTFWRRRLIPVAGCRVPEDTYYQSIELESRLEWYESGLKTGMLGKHLETYASPSSLLSISVVVLVIYGPDQDSRVLCKESGRAGAGETSAYGRGPTIRRSGLLRVSLGKRCTFSPMRTHYCSTHPSGPSSTSAVHVINDPLPSMSKSKTLTLTVPPI
jgi:hypothetical protein